LPKGEAPVEWRNSVSRIETKVGPVEWRNSVSRIETSAGFRQAQPAVEISRYLPDLAEAAIIREVHVYGQSLPVGDEKDGAAQHIGLGTELIEQAEKIARERGYLRLAVIAAVGTRKYYEERGFERGELYLVKKLTH